jgi:hypothetical protein
MPAIDEPEGSQHVKFSRRGMLRAAVAAWPAAMQWHFAAAQVPGPSAAAVAVRGEIDAREFGADDHGDATDSLRRLFDACLPTGRTAVLSGIYNVSGPITGASWPVAHLHIRCAGDVVIRVAHSAAPFHTLLACRSAAPNGSSITGGRLTLELARRCANGLMLRHDGAEGGTVQWGPVTVRDALNLDPSDVNENQAILVHGRYQHISLFDTRVSGVDRVNASAGACKGISISNAAGQVTLHAPYVELVRCGGAQADADGISVFAQPSPTGVYAFRSADVQILQPVVRDCQGRSIKLQASESLIDRPRIYRRAVATIGTADIDFQVGNGLLRDASFDYRRMDGGANPLHEAFYPISVQQQSPDRPMHARIVGGVLRAQMPLPRLVYVTVGDAARDSVTTVEGFELMADEALASGHFTRAAIEFSAAQAARAAGSTTLCVRALRGRMSGAPLLGYTDVASAHGASLQVELVGNTNTGAAASAACELVGPVSGPRMPRWRSFVVRDNVGISDLQSGLMFDVDTLAAGTAFHCDLSSCRIGNGPPGLPATGIALVQVVGQGVAPLGRAVRISVGGPSFYAAERDVTGQWRLAH